MKIYNLVFVSHPNQTKPYLFQIPLDVQLTTMQKVFCDTVKGKAIGTTVTPNFYVSADVMSCVSAGCGAYLPLKFVTGKAVQSESYNEEPFDTGLPF